MFSEKELFLAYELAKALSLYVTTEKSVIVKALYAEIAASPLIDGVSVNETLIEKFEVIFIRPNFLLCTTKNDKMTDFLQISSRIGIIRT